MQGTSKPSSNGVTHAGYEEDGEAPEHHHAPLSSLEVRRSRTKLAYEMLGSRQT